MWVVDAPLFEPADEATAAGDVAVGSGAWTAVHHAFTSPKPDSLETFDTDPGNALAYAYDIVCNGNEIGGGSIRIHREDVQKRVFKVMGLTDEEATEKFGFLLDAFKFGAPPHGGIAFGWDRITALLAGTESIRDVIAFPKSGGGFDPLTGGAGADHPGAAQGGRRRRQAGEEGRPEGLRPGPAMTYEILPSTSKGRVPFSDGETWYRITGDLSRGVTPLVVAHGGPGATHEYLLSLTAMARDRPVIHYDQLGCGNSTHLQDADPSYWTVDLFLAELDNLLEELGIADGYHLLGQSWGGMLSAEHAVRRPAGLKRLVISNSPASMPLWLEAAASLRRRAAAGGPGDAAQA